MKHFISEFASLITIIDLAAGIVFLYKIIKKLADVKSIKGKIISAVFTLSAFSLIIYGIDSKFPNLIKKPFILLSISFPIFILLMLPSVFRLYHRFAKKEYNINALDNLDGYKFENACADILRANGFKNVRVTKGSGDFGIDILAEKGSRLYGVQCKRYSHRLDNTPIQEVLGGLSHYGCTDAAVMTNQDFTEPAMQLARENKVELWDRNVLKKMILKTAKTKKK